MSVENHSYKIKFLYFHTLTVYGVDTLYSNVTVVRLWKNSLPRIQWNYMCQENGIIPNALYKPKTISMHIAHCTLHNIVSEWVCFSSKVFLIWK